MACGLTLYLSGIKDDLVGLRYRKQIYRTDHSHSLIPLSGLWINNLYGLFGIDELTPWLGIPSPSLLTVFIVNAINLIDGIDGLASGLSSISLLITRLSIHLLWPMDLCNTCIFHPRRTTSFLLYNVLEKVDRCKKIFMGDTGSLTLGYILAFLAISLHHNYNRKSPLFRRCNYSCLFCIDNTMFDVIRVVLVRARNHKPLFEADRNHLHHKFLDMGFNRAEQWFLSLTMALVFSCLNIMLWYLLW